MLARLFLLFIVVPLVELVVLLQLARLTSPGFTVLVVIVTGGAGILLARAQGFRTFRRIQSDLSSGRMPADALLDAMMILVAGALLLTPGVLTDAFGLSLLVPRCRRLYRKWLVRWFKSHVTLQGQGVGREGNTNRSEVIDSYVVDRHQEEDSA